MHLPRAITWRSMSFPKQERFPSFDQSFSARSRAFGHPARLNILRQLSKHERLCVKEIAQNVPLTIMTVSAHLRTLRRLGFVRVEEYGLYNYYMLDREAVMEYNRVFMDFCFDVIQ